MGSAATLRAGDDAPEERERSSIAIPPNKGFADAARKAAVTAAAAGELSKHTAKASVPETPMLRPGDDALESHGRHSFAVRIPREGVEHNDRASSDVGSAASRTGLRVSMRLCAHGSSTA
jgi:hypothetical protein